MSAARDIANLRTLSLGCGRDIRADQVNLDIAALEGVDVVHDLTVVPLPFEDARFDEIRCYSILEHIDYVKMLADLHRILTPGGRLRVVVPHFSSPSAFENPQHTHYFTSQTLHYFVKGHALNYCFSFSFSRIDQVRIVFVRSYRYPWNYGIEPIVNLAPAMQRFYENSPIRVFPASSISATLVK